MFEDHLLNLGKVFDRLKKAGLRLKPTKCHLAKPQLEYLGYIVSAQGIAADPKKVQAIKSFPVPANLKTLRSFLGLTLYYRRFIPCFAAEGSEKEEVWKWRHLWAKESTAVLVDLPAVNPKIHVWQPFAHP